MVYICLKRSDVTHDEHTLIKASGCKGPSVEKERPAHEIFFFLYTFSFSTKHQHVFVGHGT